MKPPITLLLLSFLIPALSRADDELAAVDAAKGLITVRQQGALKVYRLKPPVEILVNGQKDALEQLRPGMSVALTLADEQTATRVAAKGNVSSKAAVPVPGTGGAAGVSPPKPAGAGAAVRQIVIKAAIDGDDKFTIQNGVISIHHGGWKKPADISINDVPWKLEWEDKDSNPFSEVRLAPFSGGNVSLEKIKGRGEAVIVESPTEANKQKLVVHFKDPANGDTKFEVQINW